MAEPQRQARGQFHWDPDSYLETMRAEVAHFDELQDRAVQAVPFAPVRVLELGIGTGHSTRRLLARFPEARVTGLDSSAEMTFRARELGVEVRLARMEDPLPDGPWDLVFAVLSVHHLTDDGKRDLFRRVREQSRSLVIGDVVAAEEQVTPLDPERDFPAELPELTEWCDGEVTWTSGDLAVVRADYS